jgi:hypothetical protein
MYNDIIECKQQEEKSNHSILQLVQEILPHNNL